MGGGREGEILRQYLDHGGWYELKGMTFLKSEDMMSFAALGPPGGGRTFVIPLVWPDRPMVRPGQAGLALRASW